MSRQKKNSGNGINKKRLKSIRDELVCIKDSDYLASSMRRSTPALLNRENEYAACISDLKISINSISIAIGYIENYLFKTKEDQNSFSLFNYTYLIESFVFRVVSVYDKAIALEETLLLGSPIGYKDRKSREAWMKTFQNTGLGRSLAQLNGICSNKNITNQNVSELRYVRNYSSHKGSAVPLEMAFGCLALNNHESRGSYVINIIEETLHDYKKIEAKIIATSARFVAELNDYYKLTQIDQKEP